MPRPRKATAVAPPKPDKIDSRICFSIAYFKSEDDAVKYGEYIRSRGDTYNGGYFHGMPCGREKDRDYTDPELGRLFGVTF